MTMYGILRAAGVVLLLACCGFAAAVPSRSARELLKEGRIDDSIAAARARLQSNPQDAEAYHVLSRAYYMVQRWDDAIANGERAVDLQPNNSDFHMWLGRAYGEKADSVNFVAAIELAKKVRRQFEQAVQLNGSNLAARSDLAEFYVEAPGFLGGGKDKARTQSNLIARTDPAAANWVLAIIAEKEKNYDLAEQEFKAAIQAGHDQAKDWLNLASFYKRRGRLNDMEAAVNKAVGMVKDQRYVYFEAAEILAGSNRSLNGAADLLRNYLSSGDPDDEAPVFEAHYLLGTILEKRGDRAGAAKEYRASLALAKDFQRAQIALQRVQ